MKYYVAYQHCVEHLKYFGVNTWMQVSKNLDDPPLMRCGDLQMVDVSFKYFPIPKDYSCANQKNRGYALGDISYAGEISYIEEDYESKLRSNNVIGSSGVTSFPDGNLYKLKWKTFEEKYRFCVKEDNDAREIIKVEQLIVFRGAAYVFKPEFK